MSLRSNLHPSAVFPKQGKLLHYDHTAELSAHLGTTHIIYEYMPYWADRQKMKKRIPMRRPVPEILYLAMSVTGTTKT